MTYKINLGIKSKDKPTFSLDYPYPTSVPIHMTIGTGDKRKQYHRFIDNCFNDNQQLLNRLVTIHSAGKTFGEINLVSKSQFKDIQLQCIRDFLNQNQEILNTLAPYVAEFIKISQK